MPVKIRQCPEGPKDTNTNGTAPPTRNGANLVIAEIDNKVDTTNIYKDDKSDEDTNALELSDIIKDVDEQDYHTDSGSESGENIPTPPGYIPPTPPRPREESSKKTLQSTSRNISLIPKTKKRATGRNHG